MQLPEFNRIIQNSLTTNSIGSDTRVPKQDKCSQKCNITKYSTMLRDIHCLWIVKVM